MINKTHHLYDSSTSHASVTFNHDKNFFYPILGDSNLMKRIKQQIRFASEVNFPVFISGEAGCEKKMWHVTSTITVLALEIRSSVFPRIFIMRKLIVTISVIVLSKLGTVLFIWKKSIN